MKRVALFTLVVVMTAIIICFAFAESSSAEEEITFRKIPWGISCDDAEKMIKQDNIDPDARIHKDYHSAIPGRSYHITDLNDLVPWFPKPKIQTTVMDGTNIVVNESKLQVAGYDLDLNGLIMYFAYLPKDNDESWNRDTVLYAASYEIDVPGDDYKSTVADLKNKLSNVYGRKFITDKKRVDGYNNTYYIWKGANDTYVILCDLDGIGFFQTKQVLIAYASKAWEDKVIEARIAFEAEKEAQKTPTPFGNGNKDGL